MIFHRAIIFVVLSMVSFMTVAKTDDESKSDQAVAKTKDKSTSGALDTVTVTAEKVASAQQKTPMSVSVLTDFDLERRKIENVHDAVSSMPNVYMIKAGNPSDAGFFTMRGITPAMEGEQAVGFFVDGVFSNSFDAELLDVDRVEVLRGPQATLYGRNSDAGVINIITKDPDTTPEYKFGLSYGSYNRTQVDAILGGSIANSNDWSYRTALKYLYSDGFFKRDWDGKSDIDNTSDFSGRMKVRWQPSDSNWDVISTFDMQNRRNGNTSYAAIDDIKKGRKYVDSDYDGVSNADIYKGQVKAVYSWDNVDFTSISAYSHEKKEDDQDMDFTRYANSVLLMDRETRYLSQELRLNSTDNGRFNWLAGAYFLHQNDENTIDYRYLSYDYAQKRNTQIDTDNYALFGNAGYYLLDNVELVAGLRYDYEKKSLSYAQTESMYGASATSYDNNDLSFDAWLPKFGVNYYATDNAMFYGSISKGYKSGGFNTLGPDGSRSYGAEYTTNYEIGLKSEWFDHRLRWNTSLFWIDMKDQQTEVASYPVSYTINSGKSVSRGVETELAWRVTDALTLTANGGYTRAYFKDFPTQVSTDSGDYGSVNYKDNRPANAPEYNYGLSADYNFQNGYFVRADYNVTGDVYFDNANTYKQSAYGLLNLFAGYENNDYGVTVWVKNVTSEKYVTRAFIMDDGKWYGRAGDPINFGVSVNVKF